MITVNGIQYQISRDFGDILLTSISEERIILGGWDDLFDDSSREVGRTYSYERGGQGEDDFDFDKDQAIALAESNLEAYAEKHFSQSEIIEP